MGAGGVLLIATAVGLIAAAVAALVLLGATAFLTRRVTQGRRRGILAAAFFPFACVVWADTVAVFQWVVNESFLHRDPGFGDEWLCPLPNGYALMMIDVTDQGWVFHPKAQVVDGVTEQVNAVDGVRALQVAGRYVLGGSDSQSYQHPEGSNIMDSYFLLDAQTDTRTNFSNYDALHEQAQQLGIALRLEPISVVYSRYRFTWFDVFAGMLLCVPPLVSAWLLCLWIWRLRRTSDAIPVSP